jgi:hypothetical protein
MPWAKAPEMFKRREASWRRMLVIQPPAPEMIVTEHCHARHGDFERSGVLDDPCLRMGVLYDLVLPFIDRVASGFCIRWPSENTVDELSLVVTYTKQCCGREHEMDRRFYSDANQTVDIQFGERSKVERR